MRAYATKNSIVDTIDSDGLTTIYRETFEQIKERHPDAIEVDYDQWWEEKTARQDTPVEWVETTEENYWEALGCLPPAIMRSGAFCVGEPYDHHARTGEPRFQAYRRSGYFYNVSSRPMTIKEFNNLSKK